MDTPLKPKTQTDIVGADLTDRYATGLRLNKEWAAQTARDHPELFPTLASGQKPQILWIGCSDSRCPETTFLGLSPGDVFVHRNIANTIHADDINAGSVVEYAVTHLKVQKVVVCGHTKCGGAMASLTDADLGETLNKWLQPIRE